MSVVSRLRRMTGEQEPANGLSGRQEEINALRRRIDAILTRRPQAAARPPYRSHETSVPLEEVIEGAEIITPHGGFFVRTESIKIPYRHGCRCLGEMDAVDMGAVALLARDASLAGLPVQDGLFLDTETTGLAGGTGTLAFLIGLGWFEAGAFVTRQIFARDFSEERACLSFLHEIVRGKRFLVTFNGKAFDVGLLSTRFILSRMENPLSRLPHLDLLHPARRLIGHRLANTCLSTLEEQVLGYARQGDLPGSEIPQRYFDWLRGRNGSLMVDVFRHNHLDILSMATLTVHLAELVAQGPSTDRHDSRDRLAAARLLLDRGCSSQAEALLRSLLEGWSPAVHLEARKLFAGICKREGRWAEAVRLWEGLVAEYPGDPHAVEELAKWHEHRTHDLRRAEELVGSILEGAQPLSEPERARLSHRLTRLRRRTGGADA